MSQELDSETIDGLREARRYAIIVFAIGAVTLVSSVQFVLGGYVVEYGWLVPMGAALTVLGMTAFARAQSVLYFNAAKEYGVTVKEDRRDEQTRGDQW